MKYFGETIWLTLATTISILVMVVSGVAYVMLYLGVDRAFRERVSFTEEAQLLETQNIRTNNIRSLIRNNTQVRQELDTYFVKEDNVVAFLGEIENLGILSGTLVNIESVNLGETIDKDGLIEELKLTMKADGSITQLFHFLSLLEYFPKALFVESSRFTQHPTELGWQGNFQIVFLRLSEGDIE